MNYSDKLRTLADWLERHPEVERELKFDRPTIWAVASDKEDFGRICRSLGSYRKGGYPGTLEAIVEVDENGEGIYRVTVSHSGSCERIPTGKTKVIPARKAMEVPEYEYKCPDSWLSL